MIWNRKEHSLCACMLLQTSASTSRVCSICPFVYLSVCHSVCEHVCATHYTKLNLVPFQKFLFPEIIFCFSSYILLKIRRDFFSKNLPNYFFLCFDFIFLPSIILAFFCDLFANLCVCLSIFLFYLMLL